MFKWHAAQRRVPASVQKLVTTAAALDRLGPEARFETAVLATATVAEGTLAGDLYLRGSGDPSLRDAGARRGSPARSRRPASTRSTGRVCGDETFFDRRRGGPASGFGISPYVGPLSALAFNRGSAAAVRRADCRADPAAFVGRAAAIALRRDGASSVTGTARAARAPGGRATVAAVGPSRRSRASCAT